MRTRTRRRATRPQLSPATVAVLATLMLFIARPHLAVLVLDGLGLALALALAAAATWIAGMALGKFRPPARIILGRFSVEFL